AIINETFARQFFPNENPLGKRIATAGDRQATAHFEVVGVAKDTKYQTLFEPPSPHLFLPLFQQYESAMMLLVRSDGNTSTLIRPVQQEIQALDRNLRVRSVGTAAPRRNSALWRQPNGSRDLRDRFCGSGRCGPVGVLPASAAGYESRSHGGAAL